MDDYGNWYWLHNASFDWFDDGLRWDGYIVDRFYGEVV